MHCWLCCDDFGATPLRGRNFAEAGGLSSPFVQFLLNITTSGQFCNSLIYGKSMLMNVKSLVCISKILIFVLIFASSFRWRLGRETPESRAEKMCREGLGASPRDWQALPFFSDSSPLKSLALIHVQQKVYTSFRYYAHHLLCDA